MARSYPSTRLVSVSVGEHARQFAQELFRTCFRPAGLKDNLAGLIRQHEDGCVVKATSPIGTIADAEGRG